MTWFARDYTVKSVSGFDRFGFSLLTLLPFAVAFYGILNLFQASTSRGKWSAAIVAVIGLILSYVAYASFEPEMSITPQIFQQFNAYFIVLLTPVTVAFFGWLAKRGKEPLGPAQNRDRDDCRRVRVYRSDPRIAGTARPLDAGFDRWGEPHLGIA